MTKAFLFLFLIVMVSCSSSKVIPVQTAAVESRPAPSWLSDRPISSSHYIGIGRVAIAGPMEEYTAIAKKNALNDLAGEIQVKVSANSLLYTLEHDERFSASFSEQIMTQTDLDLEGFEVYDSYQSLKEYWVYYRLDKVKYEAIKEERHAKAIEKASNDLDLARKARYAGNVTLAAEYFVKALSDLRPYWGEDNVNVFREADGAIDKLALAELMDMHNNFKLKSDEDHIQLNVDNDFEQTVIIRSLIDGRNTEAVPFVYRQGKGPLEKKMSDLIRIKVRPGLETREELSVEVDPFETLRKDLTDPAFSFVKTLLKGLVFQADIQVEYPAMSLVSKQESTDGAVSSSQGLQAAMMKHLSKEHIAMDTSSPYQIRITAKSRDGGISQGFQVVYTDLSIIAKNSYTDEVLFQKSINGVKGIHSNLISASEKSLQKAAQSLDEELMKALLDAMF